MVDADERLVPPTVPLEALLQRLDVDGLYLQLHNLRTVTTRADRVPLGDDRMGYPIRNDTA